MLILQRSVLRIEQLTWHDNIETLNEIFILVQLTSFVSKLPFIFAKHCIALYCIAQIFCWYFLHRMLVCLVFWFNPVQPLVFELEHVLTQVPETSGVKISGQILIKTACTQYPGNSHNTLVILEEFGSKKVLAYATPYLFSDLHCLWCTWFKKPPKSTSMIKHIDLILIYPAIQRLHVTEFKFHFQLVSTFNPYQAHQKHIHLFNHCLLILVQQLRWEFDAIIS